MTKVERLEAALSNLQTASTDVEASAVVSEDGLIMASLLPRGLEEAQIAAMSAAMLTIGTRTARELKRGRVEQIFVKGGDGYVVIMAAGAHAVLLGLARKDAKLGLVFLDASRAAEEIRAVLS
jgi:predicted regulator of Ras-like GTPase activity (Roadblock/LC7/MglB family)